MITDSELVEELGSFAVQVVRALPDDVWFLIHRSCGSVVCRVEAGDELSVLAIRAQSHLMLPCPLDQLPPKTSSEAERRRLMDDVLGGGGG